MSKNGQNIERIAELFHEMERDELIPFANLLGLRFESLDEHSICLKFEIKEELIGNSVAKMLHGGVISAALDTVGGYIAGVENMKKIDGLQDGNLRKSLMKTGTIDLRVDYLRPGQGKYFLATGSIIRMGKKIAISRMKLHNDKGVLIAVGTGTYTVR